MSRRNRQPTPITDRDHKPISKRERAQYSVERAITDFTPQTVPADQVPVTA
jgi:hypothetical protein